ncbi:MAG TPA: DUF932 domain-containing protein [Roseiflexaceae bacterium]|nr:DUF932 domain-containing protein [Roseiflexaceae bacterium]
MITGLTDDEIRAVAPSVFATVKAPSMSDRYGFISTSQVLAALRSEGFVPVRAQQTAARVEGRADYARHALTFRLAQPQQRVGEVLPELLVLNAHDGSTAYRLMVGAFRLICMNGLVVSESSLAAFRVAHQGERTVAEVITATHHLVAQLPQVLDQVDSWRGIELSPAARLLYAQAALRLRYPKGGAPLAPSAILLPRRPEDNRPDLWTTFNLVQENLVQGGLPGQAASGRRTTTRPIAGVSSSLALNTGLWELSARTAAGLLLPEALAVEVAA